MLRTILAILFVLSISAKSYSCSIVYFIDSTTGKIYVGNHEDYWYNVKDYHACEKK